MRKLSIFLLVLGSLSTYAQSTRLPQRRTSSGTAAPASRPAVRTESRPTSSKLPENRAFQTPPPPPPEEAPAPAPVRSSPRPGLRPAFATRQRSERLAYKKGDNLLQVGLGLSSYYSGNPIGITYEAGIDKDISLGAQIDYTSGTYSGYNYYYGYYSSYRLGYTATYFGLRASYHANRLLSINSDKFDLYAGLGLGYVSFKWNDSYGSDADYRSRVFFNYFLGAKYYFSPHIGAFAEVGYTGISSTRIGLAAKF